MFNLIDSYTTEEFFQARKNIKNQPNVQSYSWTKSFQVSLEKMLDTKSNLNGFDHQYVSPTVISTTWFVTNGLRNFRHFVAWKSTHKDPTGGGKRVCRIANVCISSILRIVIVLQLHTTVIL